MTSTLWCDTANNKLMREGYVQGLKKAQNIIRKMIKESVGDVDEIIDFIKRINDQFDNVFDVASADEDEFDTGYLVEHGPFIEVFSNGDREVTEIIEKAVYDTKDDSAYFQIYPNDGTVSIPNFSKVWEESQRHAHGNRSFYCACEIDGDDYPKSKVTIYFA